MGNTKINKNNPRYDASVERLQREMVRAGMNIKVDGINGPNTKAATDVYNKIKLKQRWCR